MIGELHIVPGSETTLLLMGAATEELKLVTELLDVTPLRIDAALSTLSLRPFVNGCTFIGNTLRAISWDSVKSYCREQKTWENESTAGNTQVFRCAVAICSRRSYLAVTTAHLVHKPPVSYEGHTKYTQRVRCDNNSIFEYLAIMAKNIHHKYILIQTFRCKKTAASHREHFPTSWVVMLRFSRAPTT